MKTVYKVGDIKSLIAESSNEFKAVLGPNVERDNKEINGKAYKDAKKRAKDFDGGLEKEIGEEKPNYEKTDANRTTLDYTPENASDEYKKRVKAQAEGYTSELEKNNGIEKTGDYSDNEKIYNGIKKSGQAMHRAQADWKASGLRARELPKDTFEHEELYEGNSKDGHEMRDMINVFKKNSALQPKKAITEGKPVKTIYFKKTAFLTEGHMISKIPDEFKNEGTRFKMKDKFGTTYLIEWCDGKADILSCNNKQKIDENMAKFHHIVDYKGEEYKNTSVSDRLNEGVDEISRMLDLMRKLNK